MQRQSRLTERQRSARAQPDLDQKTEIRTEKPIQTRGGKKRHENDKCSQLFFLHKMIKKYIFSLEMTWHIGPLSDWVICLYGICCAWVRGGWGLDALGKFFRRRRRRRRRRPGFGHFSSKYIIFSKKCTFRILNCHFPPGFQLKPHINQKNVKKYHFWYF